MIGNLKTERPLRHDYSTPRRGPDQHYASRRKYNVGPLLQWLAEFLRLDQGYCQRAHDRFGGSTGLGQNSSQGRVAANLFDN